MRWLKLFSVLAWGMILVPTLQAQNGSIRGQVIDVISQSPLPGVNVVVQGTTVGAATNVEGAFVIENLAPDTYTLEARFVGYEPLVLTDVVVQPSRPTVVVIRLRETAVLLEGVAVEASGFTPPADAPTSVRFLGAEEIRRAPGGQNDVSRTLLSLPGVTGGVDNRNDLIVRGGGPSENAYYLDGIRIPQINHFATQGATGGAVGLLNVDFIRETEFFTGGFPVRYGEALSSVLLIDNRSGSPDRVAGDFTLGAAEAGLTLDGPIGSKANWLFSIRRSYLQFLFQALGLPIRPGYWDSQLRLQFDPSPRDRFTVVGLGAIDQFDIAAAAEAEDFEDREILQRLLDNDQTSYTLGGTWRRLIPQGVVNLAVSRSATDYRFADRDSAGVALLTNRSLEAENRLAVDADRKLGRTLTLGVGGGATYATLDTEFLQRDLPGTAFNDSLNFQDALAFGKLNAYAQLSARLLGGRLSTTLGLRADETTFLDNGFAFSPRASASFNLTRTLSANAAAGLFHQSPAALSLIIRQNGEFVNQGLRPVRVTQFVGGFAWQPGAAQRVTVEAFYKDYDRYPVSANDPRLSLANLGGDFGFIGAERLLSTGQGRAYGLEVFSQRKLTSWFYGIAAYTLSWSEFAGADGRYRPSAWDVRHSASFTGGVKLGRRWELSSKWRLLSGRPYTPFDLAASATQYALTGNGVPDYDRLNAERTPTYSRMDVRIDRRFFFRGWNGVLYFDIQNILNQTNLFGFRYTEDPAFPDNLRPVDNVGLLPIFGFSVEW